MRKEMITGIINAMLQDIKDRNFITTAKRCLVNMNDKDKSEPDVAKLIVLLSSIIDNNTNDAKEILYEASQTDFTDEVKMAISTKSQFSRGYKRDLLDRLNAMSVKSKVDSTVKEIVDSLTTIDYSVDKPKDTVEALRRFMKASDELYKTTSLIKVGSSSSNTLIIDPNSDSTYGTILPVLDDLRQDIVGRVKTIPAIDMLMSGGFGNKTLTLFAAYTGSGKSMILQNIAMYASMKNECKTINDDYKPCILLVSLELTRKQLLTRHLQWCGVKIEEEDMRHMNDHDVEKLIIETNKKAGLQIPIVYVERLSGDYYTTVAEIEDEFNNCINAGFMPIMVLIDYIDRLEVYSSKHQNLGLSGADGAALLRQKVKECRDLAINKNVPVVSAAQLSGDVGNVIYECGKYPRQVDPALNFSSGSLAGSKALSREVELIIFCHKVSIEEKNEETNQINYQNFMSMCVKKDRDNVAKYILSSRDIENESIYTHYTKGLKNAGPVRQLISNSSDIHVTIPLDKFRIVDDDYGRSIRMFYLSEDSSLSYEPFEINAFAPSQDELVLDMNMEESEFLEKISK